jgi:YHS domain-containing protein
MNGRTKRITVIIMLAGLLVLGVLAGVGCKKKSEPAAPAQPANEPNAVVAAAGAIEQKLCPVMEAPINKDLFTVYEGKKVYFCCAGCKEKFEANPQEYLAKLPQFKQ